MGHRYNLLKEELILGGVVGMSMQLPHMYPPKMRVCHVAAGGLWAGAEVQLKVSLSKLVQSPEFQPNSWSNCFYK